jgi:hypothetical protein
MGRFAGPVATSGSGGKSEVLRLGRSEAERFALLSPKKRCAKTKLLDGEMRGLAAFEDGLHDIRCEKCAAEDPTDISLSYVKLLGDCPSGMLSFYHYAST